MSLVVVAPGVLATLQDAGRPGHGVIGVTSGGAADRTSAARANRLVGNGPGAPVVEALLGGLVVRATERHVVAVTGAPAPLAVDGRPAPLGEPVVLAPGAVLAVGAPVAGLRCYLAVQGGLAGERVLASVGTSPGIGPGPLRAGRRLDVVAGGGPVRPDLVPGAGDSWGPVTARVVLGPRHDWFTPAALGALLATAWTATSDVDRVGLRLDGPALQRARDGELASEGMVPGAVQVPPSGRPIVFLADAPTTGGYPVVACVVDADLDRLAQVRPGDVVRLTPVPAAWR